MISGDRYRRGRCHWNSWQLRGRAVKLNDFRKIIGAEKGDRDDLPVAMLLRTGYGCLGTYSVRTNEGLTDTVLVINAQLATFAEHTRRSRPVLEDFREFLTEFVTAGEDAEFPVRKEFGKPIPLAAISVDDIAIVYPVAHIMDLLRLASGEQKKQTPHLLDIERSEILRLLRTKLW